MAERQGMRKIGEGRMAEIYDRGDGSVIKLVRVPEWTAALEWEAAAMQAAAATGAVPAVMGMETALGRPGLVMERIQGQDLLTVLGRRPWRVLQIGRVLGEVHARIHTTVAPVSLRPLRASVEQALRSSPDVPQDLLPPVLRVLETLPDADVLCHGDFHPGNLIMAGNRPAVIDWQNVTRGHPDADVARTLLLLEGGAPPPGTSPVVRLLSTFGRGILRSAYLRSYRRHRPLDELSLQRWGVIAAAHRLTEPIPEEREWLLGLLAKGLNQKDRAGS